MTTVSPLVQACADKLQREMEEFGFPPEFPEEEEEDTSSKKARHCKHANKQGTPSAVHIYQCSVFIHPSMWCVLPIHFLSARCVVHHCGIWFACVMYSSSPSPSSHPTPLSSLLTRAGPQQGGCQDGEPAIPVADHEVPWTVGQRHQGVSGAVGRLSRQRGEGL